MTVYRRPQARKLPELVSRLKGLMKIVDYMNVRLFLCLIYTQKLIPYNYDKDIPSDDFRNLPAGIQNPDIIEGLPDQLEASNPLLLTPNPDKHTVQKRVRQTFLNQIFRPVTHSPTIERDTARSNAEVARDF